MAVDRQRIYHKRDRLRQLRAFCQVARLGHITRAAAQLGLTQPAVSIQVRELENELEAILFHRDRSGLSLTRAGTCLYALAEPLVQGMDELHVNLAGHFDDCVEGDLQIAASMAATTLVLPPYIKQFRDRYPGIRIRVRHCRFSDAVKLVLDDEVEFVFGAKDADDGETLEYRELLVYDLVLITSLDHPLARRETVTPEEAAVWPAIVPPAGTHARQFGESLARRYGVDFKAVIEVGSWETTKRFVEVGLGVAIVPSLCVAETDQLSMIAMKEYCPARSYGVYTTRGRILRAPARRFLRLMMESSVRHHTKVPRWRREDPADSVANVWPRSERTVRHQELARPPS